MSHNLFVVFPLPVVLALAALILLLLAIGRVLAEMGKPVPVRVPVHAAPPLPPYDQPPPAARACRETP